MSQVRAVVGMNYGDEGKGHIVNYYSGVETLNVRFNGGSQAAHAVNLSNGKSHVFHHFGSGSLCGARTLLTRDFIVNPIIYMKELNELLDKGVPMRETLIDQRAVVTTPYDILINHYFEIFRGTKSSVGVGINETVERSQYDELCLTTRKLKDMSKGQLMKKMEQLENEWVPFRAEQLGFKIDDFKRYAAGKISDQMVDAYIDYVKWMLDKSVVWEDSDVIEKYLVKHPRGNVVFEGAQGMLLDEKRMEYFPYLTRSRTGLSNVFRVMRDMREKRELEVVGVTRAYLTRHGDGPMFDERDGIFSTLEISNPENKYQGKMRFGLLDMEWYEKCLDELEMALIKSKVKGFIENGNVIVAMTCLDNAEFSGDNLRVVEKGKEKYVPLSGFRQLSVESWGPKENNIKEREKT